ncbi:hypothetical protein BJX76DRAFT_358032 [Aspergillus varians]
MDTGGFIDTIVTPQSKAAGRVRLLAFSASIRVMTKRTMQLAYELVSGLTNMMGIGIGNWTLHGLLLQDHGRRRVDDPVQMEEDERAQHADPAPVHEREGARDLRRGRDRDQAHEVERDRRQDRLRDHERAPAQAHLLAHDQAREVQGRHAQDRRDGLAPAHDEGPERVGEGVRGHHRLDEVHHLLDLQRAPGSVRLPEPEAVREGGGVQVVGRAGVHVFDLGHVERPGQARDDAQVHDADMITVLCMMSMVAESTFLHTSLSASLTGLRPDTAFSMQMQATLNYGAKQFSLLLPQASDGERGSPSADPVAKPSNLNLPKSRPETHLILFKVEAT